MVEVAIERLCRSGGAAYLVARRELGCRFVRRGIKWGGRGCASAPGKRVLGVE